TEGYEYGSFHFLEPSFLHNYTDSTNELALYILIGNNKPEYGETKNASYYVVVYQKSFMFFINQRWFVKAPLC
ncbi:hypothetical protein, partial [Paenibacillus larvae]